jgi:hypothetical protein
MSLVSAVCAAGYGPRGVQLRCSKCVSQRTAAALFAVAMLVLLIGIRFWAFLAGEGGNGATALITACGRACNVHTLRHKFWFA